VTSLSHAPFTPGSLWRVKSSSGEVPRAAARHITTTSSKSSIVCSKRAPMGWTLRRRVAAACAAALGEWASTRTTTSASCPRVEEGTMVTTASTPPSALAFRPTAHRLSVSPEPEPITSRSPAAKAGVVTSPTTCACSPRCMRRMAKARTTRPERPAPATKTRRAATSRSSSARSPPGSTARIVSPNSSSTVSRSFALIASPRRGPAAAPSRRRAGRRRGRSQSRPRRCRGARRPPRAPWRG